MTTPARSLGLVLLALAGCGAVGPVQDIAAFADRPQETFAFQYTQVDITGIVWGFERDGRYLDYGGPVGLIYEDETAFAVSISGTGIALLSMSDVLNVNPDRMADLISAAESYCETEGYRRDQGGASVYSDDETLYLIGFCGPTP